MSSPIHGNPAPRRVHPAGPLEHAVHPGEVVVRPHGALIPEAERSFFVEEFRGVTVVVSLPTLDDGGRGAVTRTVAGFAPGDTRLVVVVADDGVAAEVCAAAATAGAE
ncbi:MAG: hypothetical protein ACTMIR_06515, partial [Cellulomonadaceae bacterium]